jgi:hypothetical protein
VNRFSSEIFILPSLKKGDYQSMIEVMAEGISDVWKKKFLELGLSRLDQAVRDKKGARYPKRSSWLQLSKNDRAWQTGHLKPKAEN